MKKVGSYVLLGEIAAGGMASVHLGRLSGPAGFSRTVAIKRLHPQFAKDPEFVSMFLDEARVAARIRHPNVVQTLDVVAADGELFLVMDYVEGESLARLLKRLSKDGQRIPLPVVSSLISGALRGLHAAHEAKSELGEPLEIVHRDVSPQNLMLGSDGVVRVLDFGIAKAVGRLQTTREGAVKGKLPYMAPEQLRGLTLSARTDVYATGVVLWECLVGERLFGGDEAHVVERILLGTVPLPSSRVREIPEALDAIVARATARAPHDRFANAADMAFALENAVRPALPPEIAVWLDGVAGASLRTRAARVHEQLQHGSAGDERPVVTPVPDEGSRAPAPDAAPAPSSESPRDGEATTTATRTSIRRRRSALAGLAFGFASISVFGIALWRCESAHDAEAALAASASPAAVASGAAARSAPSAAAAPLAAGAPDASAAPLASAPPSASAGVAPPAPKAGGKKTKLPVHTTHVDCTIPYVVDATGKRVYRRECLK